MKALSVCHFFSALCFSLASFFTSSSSSSSSSSSLSQLSKSCFDTSSATHHHPSPSSTLLMAVTMRVVAAVSLRRGIVCNLQSSAPRRGTRLCHLLFLDLQVLSIHHSTPTRLLRLLQLRLHPILIIHLLLRCSRRISRRSRRTRRTSR